MSRRVYISNEAQQFAKPHLDPKCFKIQQTVDICITVAPIISFEVGYHLLVDYHNNRHKTRLSKVEQY